MLSAVLSLFVPAALCGLGLAVGGGLGLAIGMVIALAVIIAGTCADWVRADPARAQAGAARILHNMTALGRIALIPFAIIAVGAIAVALYALGFIVFLGRQLLGPYPRRIGRWMSQRQRLEMPVWSLRLPSQRALRADLGRSENLAMLLLNLVLLLALACIAFGMQVALYVALILTPIWLIGLILLALQSNDPEFVFDSEPDEDQH